MIMNNLVRIESVGKAHFNVCSVWLITRIAAHNITLTAAGEAKKIENDRFTAGSRFVHQYR